MNGAALTKAVIAKITSLNGKAINLIAASTAGHADVIACYQGKYIELEIKGSGDREKPHQALKLNEAIKAGGYGAFIHSLDDLDEVLSLVRNNQPCPLVKAKLDSLTL